MISSNALAEPLPPPEPPKREVVSGAPPPGLSNDYLNHYSEVLMLIEMAAADPEIRCELARWRPLDYRSYFAASPLRRADEALAAYEALPQARRLAFETMTGAMDELAQAAIASLAKPGAAEDSARVAEATAPSLRRLIDRAANFLNSGGETIVRAAHAAGAQAAIDAVIARSAAAE